MNADTEYLDTTITRVVKILAWAVVFIVLIFFTTVTGCTIYSNSVEAEQTLANAEFAKENKHILDQKNKAIIDLVNQGVNPMLARCTIIGWNGSYERMACENLAERQVILND